MKNDTLGGFRSIDAFVESKLERFSASEKSFSAMFELMFSEETNVMFEWSEGYRVAEKTYGEVRRDILLRSAVLSAKLADVEKGSAVGLYLENSIDWIELFWAILACGYRPVLMNMRLDRSSLSAALASCGARDVIARRGAPDFGVPAISADELSPGTEAYSPAGFGEEILVMSSGTSDHVKVCAYGAEEFHCMIRDSAVIIKNCPAMKKHYKGRLKQLAFLPFCHIFGLVAVYLWFAFFSRTFVLLNDMTPATIVSTIRRHEVTHIFAVPLFWNKVRDEALKAIRERGDKTYGKFLRGLRISDKLANVPVLGSAFRRLAFREVRENLFGESICFLISGGSEIGSDVLGFFNAIGYHLANGYGMTEIGITSVELSSDYRRLTDGSVGLPFSSVEYRIDGGRLLVRGASCARTVIEGESRTERGGFFPTGDLAEYKNGRYYILGRADDVVISPTGENLNPCLIEDKLAVSGTRGCCLTSVREGSALKPVLVVSMKPLMSGEAVRETFENVKSRIAENGLSGQIGKIVLVCEPLLGEDDFKLNRAKIAARLASGGFTVIDPNAVNDGGAVGDAELINEIRSLFASALGKNADEIANGSDFFLDLGGSSLDYFAVIVELQHKYGVAFPADSGRSLSRPDEIADFIISALGSERG